MNESEFGDYSPGRLVQTSFVETGARGELKTATGYAFVPNELPPLGGRGHLLLNHHDALVKAERALSQLDGIASQVENPTILISPFQYREARLSSAIENTFASAEQMALHNIDPSALELTKRDEVAEVNNYVAALTHGFKAKEPICLRLIKEMHAILLSGVKRSAGRVGEFRSTQNAIGKAGASFNTARFVPPPPTEINRLLQNWESYIHSDKKNIPALIKFAIAHYQFECIHPFDDGNGRIGRLLISLKLCKQAQLSSPMVYVSGYFEQHRSSYYDLLLDVSKRGSWNRWISFFLDAVYEQAADATTRFKDLATLRTKYMEAVRVRRASAMLPIVIDHLFGFPAVSIAGISKLTNLSPQAAGSLVAKLEDKKILTEITGRKSSRIWIAPEIVQIIDT